MNPFDSFTVERLEELADCETWPKASHVEMQALAKIALAVKQAKPVNYPEIPEGWVMVPKEPTDQMVMAAMCSDDVSFGNDKDEEFFVEHRNIYGAMLAAAPKPE